MNKQKAIPPIDERNKVYAYLLTMGFSKRKASSFDPRSREYDLALSGMKYRELINA